MTGKSRSEGTEKFSSGGKRVLDRRNRKCKGAEVLSGLRNSEGASVAGVEPSRRCDR